MLGVHSDDRLLDTPDFVGAVRLFDCQVPDPGVRSAAASAGRRQSSERPAPVCWYAASGYCSTACRRAAGAGPARLHRRRRACSRSAGRPVVRGRDRRRPFAPPPPCSRRRSRRRRRRSRSVSSAPVRAGVDRPKKEPVSRVRYDRLWRAPRWLDPGGRRLAWEARRRRRSAVPRGIRTA